MEKSQYRNSRYINQQLVVSYSGNDHLRRFEIPLVAYDRHQTQAVLKSEVRHKNEVHVAQLKFRFGAEQVRQAKASSQEIHL